MKEFISKKEYKEFIKNTVKEMELLEHKQVEYTNDDLVVITLIIKGKIDRINNSKYSKPTDNFNIARNIIEEIKCKGNYNEKRIICLLCNYKEECKNGF